MAPGMAIMQNGQCSGEELCLHEKSRGLHATGRFWRGRLFLQFEEAPDRFPKGIFQPRFYLATVRRDFALKRFCDTAARGEEGGLIWTINRGGEKFFREDKGEREEGVAIN